MLQQVRFALIVVYFKGRWWSVRRLLLLALLPSHLHFLVFTLYALLDAVKDGLLLLNALLMSFCLSLI